MIEFWVLTYLTIILWATLLVWCWGVNYLFARACGSEPKFRNVVGYVMSAVLTVLAIAFWALIVLVEGLRP